MQLPQQQQHHQAGQDRQAGGEEEGEGRMRLQLISTKIEGQHGQLASAVSWPADSASDIFSCSDDQSIQRWSPQGHSMGKAGPSDWKGGLVPKLGTGQRIRLTRDTHPLNALCRSALWTALSRTCTAARPGARSSRAQQSCLQWRAVMVSGGITPVLSAVSSIHTAPNKQP